MMKEQRPSDQLFLRTRWGSLAVTTGFAPKVCQCATATIGDVRRRTPSRCQIKRGCWISYSSVDWSRELVLRSRFPLTHLHSNRHSRVPLAATPPPDCGGSKWPRLKYRKRKLHLDTLGRRFTCVDVNSWTEKDTGIQVTAQRSRGLCSKSVKNEHLMHQDSS